MALDPATQLQVTQLQAEIAALQSAIISGATRVSYDGKAVEYDDINGLRTRLQFATDLLNTLLNPNYRRPQAGFVKFHGYSKRPVFGGFGTWRG